jgi:hypothetical protein
MRRSTDMLAKLIIFVVDLILALAIVVTLYAVFLMAAIGVFVSVIFYMVKGEMEENYDFNKGRNRVLDSSNATGKPLVGNTESQPQDASCPLSSSE